MKIRGFALLTLLFTSNIGIAEGLTSEFGLESDRVFRGVSKTDHGPAAHASMHYNFDFGLSLGASMANVGADEARSMEGCLDFAYNFPLNDKFTVELTTQYYHNPSASNADTFNLGLGAKFYELLKLSAFYSPKFFGTGISASYYVAETIFDLIKGQNLTVRLSAGHSRFADEARAGNRDYSDARIAFHHQQANHDVGLFYVATNRRIIDGRGYNEPAYDDGFGASYTVKLK